MGYSVYIKVKPSAFPGLEKFLQSEELRSFLDSNLASKLSGGFVIDHGLSYINDKHLTSYHLIGVNYGEYDTAHTMVRALATILKRKWYEYDGVERIKVDQEYCSSEMKLITLYPKNFSDNDLKYAQEREAILSDLFNGIIKLYIKFNEN